MVFATSPFLSKHYMKKYFLTASLLCLTGLGFAQADTNESSNNSRPKPIINSKLLPPIATVPEIKLFPNPAKNKIMLQVKGFAPGMATVKIIDTKGRIQREDSRLLITGDEEVVMFLALRQGIYYIIVGQKGKLAKKKLVIL